MSKFYYYIFSKQVIYNNKAFIFNVPFTGHIDTRICHIFLKQICYHHKMFNIFALNLDLSQNIHDSFSIRFFLCSLCLYFKKYLFHVLHNAFPSSSGNKERHRALNLMSNRSHGVVGIKLLENFLVSKKAQYNYDCNPFYLQIFGNIF